MLGKGYAIYASPLAPRASRLRGSPQQLEGGGIVRPAIKPEAVLRRAERRRAVRILRAEGFLSLDASNGSLVAAQAAAGTFRLGGAVVGTHAFRLYEGDWGLRLRLDQTALTNDLDVASFERLSLALEDTPPPPLTEALSSLSFTPVPTLGSGTIVAMEAGRRRHKRRIPDAVLQ